MPDASKVLVIESDRELNSLICDSLKDAGHEPRACEPEQAVELAASLPAAAIIAALTSVAYENAPLYQALRGDPRTRNIPLVLITGRGDVTIRRKLGEKPPYVLFKPFELDVLMGAVAQALAGD